MAGGKAILRYSSIGKTEILKFLVFPGKRTLIMTAGNVCQILAH